MNTDDRTFEVLVEGLWLPTSFCDIEQGESFRVLEANGQPVTDSRGYSVWTANHDREWCS